MRSGGEEVELPARNCLGSHKLNQLLHYSVEILDSKVQESALAWWRWGDVELADATPESELVLELVWGESTGLSWGEKYWRLPGGKVLDILWGKVLEVGKKVHLSQSRICDVSCSILGQYLIVGGGQQLLNYTQQPTMNYQLNY